MAKIKKEQIIDSGKPEESSERPITTESVELLVRITRLEEGLDSLKFILDFVKSTNWFILVVLFVGFAALIITTVLGAIQAFNSNKAADIEYIKSTEDLKTEVNNLNMKLYQATSSGILIQNR